MAADQERAGTADQRERERDLERFLTFVDAVVAIAITLLILPLVEVASDIGDTSVADLLNEHQGQIGAFLLSFVVIAALWIAQHQVMSPVVVTARWITQVLFCWLLTIVSLPFSTALVAQAGDDPLTKILYIGSMALSSGLLWLTAVLVGRDPASTGGAEPPAPLPSAGTALGMLLALALSLAVPALGYYPLLVLMIVPFVVERIERRRRGAVSR